MRAYGMGLDGGWGKKGATGTSEARFGGIEAREVFEVSRCGWYVDGAGADVDRVIGEYAEDVQIEAGEFEVWWLVVVPKVVVGRAGYDVSVDMVKVGGWWRQRESGKVGVKYGCFWVQQIVEVCDFDGVAFGGAVG